MPAVTAADLASRIEALWGQPLGELRQEAEEHPGSTMLGAVVRLHTDTDFAERTIAYHRDRLRQLSDPGREIDDSTARHLLDTAQRLAIAVTARTAHLAAATAVLDGLRRRDPMPVPAQPADLAAGPAQPAALVAGPAQPADLLRTR
ncbi:hypothetical protein V2S66_18715 [Streptomyces sp. V4-01]|uniref:DUF222 domain-containing protein n=1 Tax=Actinacidiphila polyblastidii TaxID=3110430 RepID=A0ABU7PDV9_9ACTN|nr:hypothetical protein [Streptomyces sp. V4-01]